MSRARAIPLLLALALHGGAATIDRIAVAVGNRVVTSSDIVREIRVTAFLNGVKPDLSETARRQAADRLVEQQLIRRELENSRYPQPAASEIQPVLEEFKAKYFPSPAAYSAALAAAGITDHEVRQELLWQRTLLAFIDVRFQPTIQISDPDIQTYFDHTVAPAARAANPAQTPALPDYRDEIRQTLTGQREDQELDTWLKEARKRVPVVYHEEAFQ